MSRFHGVQVSSHLRLIFRHLGLKVHHQGEMTLWTVLKNPGILPSGMPIGIEQTQTTPLGYKYKLYHSLMEQSSN